jgi:hypothetical protein
MQDMDFYRHGIRKIVLRNYKCLGHFVDCVEKHTCSNATKSELLLFEFQVICKKFIYYNFIFVPFLLLSTTT